ncbi:MAG: arsenate reductase family protein [Tissierellia bacterium]|nr:arsenate reductase family protein [Tissierellia bacterium]
MNILIGYKKCSTCRDVEKLLEQKNWDYTFRSIVEDTPTKKELKQWHQASGLPIGRFFNTSGILYREMNLKDKRPHMRDEEAYALLATDGMLIKRPILLHDDEIYVGPDVKKFLSK